MIFSPETLHGFFYRSQLSPDCDSRCVTDIVRTARHFNEEHGITGILIFDGQQFCQYLEGPARTMDDLVDRIATDPRHVMFTALYQASDLPARRFTDWSMAYVLIGDGDEPLSILTKLQGIHTVDKLQAWLPQLDMV